MAKDDEKYAKSLLSLTKRPKRPESVNFAGRIMEQRETKPVCAENLFRIDDSPISLTQKPAILNNNNKRKSSEFDHAEQSAF